MLKYGWMVNLKYRKYGFVSIIGVHKILDCIFEMILHIVSLFNLTVTEIYGDIIQVSQDFLGCQTLANSN